MTFCRLLHFFAISCTHYVYFKFKQINILLEQIMGTNQHFVRMLYSILWPQFIYIVHVWGSVITVRTSRLSCCILSHPFFYFFFFKPTFNKLASLLVLQGKLGLSPVSLFLVRSWLMVPLMVPHADTFITENLQPASETLADGSIIPRRTTSSCIWCVYIQLWKKHRSFSDLSIYRHLFE